MKAKGELEIDVKPANLWSKIKVQCLNTNPYLGENEDGQAIMRCPRCETWTLEMDYTSFSISPAAIEWASAVVKCQKCSHIFSFVR